METTLTSSEVTRRCTSLKQAWQPRNAKMKEWYRLVQMVDELKQQNMESFVGNDPRASFNLITSMLDQKIPHRIAASDLTHDLIEPSQQVSALFDTIWRDIYYRYRQRGKYFLRDLIGLFVATGWYSVFATMTTDGTRCIAEVWNPASVFPAWDDTLVECAHIFPVSASESRRMIARAGWNKALAPSTSSTCYDYWRVDDNGRVLNSVVIGKELVKPEETTPFKRIPIFIAPAGGLPDTGFITGDVSSYRAEVGQSALATNEKIYRSWNRWWTFSMQLMRDTAQPRWIEKSNSSARIVKPEDVFKYGTVFKMGVQDDFHAVQMPAIPVEIRASQIDMEAMMQRGGPTWSAFGNIQQQLSTYVMSQISASLRNVTLPFHSGIIDCISDIDNFFKDMIIENNYKPYDKEYPKEVAQDIQISAEYEIKIPGDVIQRATAARMLNPNFELSDARIMQELFPEVKNPYKEMADIRAGKAEKHPLRVMIAMIESFREEAIRLDEANDTEGARLYKKAADQLESQLGVAEESSAPTPNGQGVPPGSLPSEMRASPSPSNAEAPPSMGESSAATLPF